MNTRDNLAKFLRSIILPFKKDPTFFFFRKTLTGGIVVFVFALYSLYCNISYQVARCCLYIVMLNISFCSALSIAETNFYSLKFLATSCTILVTKSFFQYLINSLPHSSIIIALQLFVLLSVIFISLIKPDPTSSSAIFLMSSAFFGYADVPLSNLGDVLFNIIIFILLYMLINSYLNIDFTSVAKSFFFLLLTDITKIPIRLYKRKMTTYQIIMLRNVLCDSYGKICKRYTSLLHKSTHDKWEEGAIILRSMVHNLMTVIYYKELIVKEEYKMLINEILFLVKNDGYLEDDILFSNKIKDFNNALSHLRKSSIVSEEEKDMNYEILFLLYNLRIHIIEIRRLINSF